MFEVKWIRLFAHCLMHGRGLYGLTKKERLALWNKYEDHNIGFVKSLVKTKQICKENKLLMVGSFLKDN